MADPIKPSQPTRPGNAPNPPESDVVLPVNDDDDLPNDPKLVEEVRRGIDTARVDTPGPLDVPGPRRGDEQDMTDLRREPPPRPPTPETTGAANSAGATLDAEDEDLDTAPAAPSPQIGTSEHRDPLSGEPGAHPVGVGIGAAAGGAAAGLAAGMAAGTIAGPVGTAVGGAIGAAVGSVIGGYAGKGIAESINPTAEDAYWRDNFRARPYVDEDADYDQYRAAYQHGWESRARYQDRTWEQAEPDVRRDWERNRANAGLAWDRARHAVRDAWERVHHRAPPARPG